MLTSKTKPPPGSLTPEERRRLVEKPFVFCRVPGKSWGGTIIGDAMPTEGKRSHKRWVSDYDEEMTPGDRKLYEEIEKELLNE